MLEGGRFSDEIDEDDEDDDDDEGCDIAAWTEMCEERRSVTARSRLCMLSILLSLYFHNV